MKGIKINEKKKYSQIFLSRHCGQSVCNVLVIQTVYKEKTFLLNRLDPGSMSGMTTTTRAFTLIELLVVVLIIGILAAVAIPQYRISVAKTRFANLRSVASTYIKAAQVYYSEFSAWPNSFDALGVQAPAGSQLIVNPGGMNSTCMVTHDLYCCVNGYREGSQNASINCGTADYSMVYKYLLAFKRSQCSVKETWLEQVCKNLQGTGRDTVSQPQPPQGAKSGYISYYIK